MDLQTLLKNLSLDDETITKIVEGMKENKIYTASEENLDVRYGKTKGDLDAKTRELEEATNLINELKAGNVNVEELQNKIKDYEENVIPALKKETEKAKVDSALKVALANAKVTDVDYITYKIKEKGELKLDDEGNIKGFDDTLKEVKTSFPSFFETEKKKEIEVKDLGTGKVGTPEPANLAEALKQQYSQKENKM